MYIFISFSYVSTTPRLEITFQFDPFHRRAVMEGGFWLMVYLAAEPRQADWWITYCMICYRVFEYWGIVVASCHGAESFVDCVAVGLEADTLFGWRIVPPRQYTGCSLLTSCCLLYVLCSYCMCGRVDVCAGWRAHDVAWKYKLLDICGPSHSSPWEKKILSLLAYVFGFVG